MIAGLIWTAVALWLILLAVKGAAGISDRRGQAFEQRVAQIARAVARQEIAAEQQRRARRNRSKR